MMTSWQSIALMGTPLRNRREKHRGASPASAIPCSWYPSSSTSEAKSPQFEKDDAPTIQVASQPPPTLNAAVVREPSVQQSQCSSTPAPTSNGSVVAKKMSTIDETSARGKVVCGRATSPEIVETESKPEKFQKFRKFPKCSKFPKLIC